MKNNRFFTRQTRPVFTSGLIKIFSSTVLSTALLGSSLFGQNQIYEKRGKVEDISATEITAQTVKGKKAKKPGATFSVNTSKVLFLFNDVGNFLVIPDHLDVNNAKFQGSMNDYFNTKNPAYIISDRIISVQGVVTTCNFKSENKKAVIYTIDNKDNSIPKNNVALIIYKDGTHKLFKDPKIIYSVLELVQNSTIPVAKADANPPVQNSVQPPVPASPPPPAANTASTNTHVNNTDSKKQTDTVASNKVQSQGDLSSNVVDKNPASSSGPEIDIKEYQDKAIAKVDEFTTYVKVISGKIDDMDEINRYIERAVKLFINEDAIIEVSNVSRNSLNRFLIRPYLQRLKQLKYESVEVKSGDYVVVQNLKKNPDGTYTGVISFEQTFIGKKGDNRVYSDKTKKNVTIILKQYSSSVEGKVVTGWDVFLSDIQVVATKQS